MDARQEELARDIHEIVRRDFEEPWATPIYGAKELWASVHDCGTDLWLDTGDIDTAAGLWCPEFRAVTTNNSLLNKEVQQGAYDDLIAKVATEIGNRVSREQLVLELAFVLNAYHALKLNRTLGARISVELHTDLAHDLERTVWYGERYYRIAPEDFYIKVPLTPTGFIAARRLSDGGVPVNFTLGFGARQNCLAAAVARPQFVNVFLGRLNSFVADNDLGPGQMVGEKTTAASQAVVQSIRGQLGTDTRQIAASMREPQQVLALAGVDVMTMPTSVAEGLQEMDPDRDAIERRIDGEYAVPLSGDLDPQKVPIHDLWTVPDALRDLAIELGDQAQVLTPDSLCDQVRGAGFGDIFPEWTDQDIATVQEDGKIPDCSHWRERIAAGQVGIDALMNLSGLHYFAADQQEMDERIRSML